MTRFSRSFGPTSSCSEARDDPALGRGRGDHRRQCRRQRDRASPVRSAGPGGDISLHSPSCGRRTERAGAGLGSDLVVFALRKDEPSYRCLGASGSVFGIVMAAVVLDPKTSIMLFFIPIPIPGPLFMLAYAVISVVLIARNQRGGISHEGHLGGAIVGLALTGVLSPRGLGPLMRWFAQWL